MPNDNTVLSKGKIMATSIQRKETRLVAQTITEIQENIQRAADYSGETLSQLFRVGSTNRISYTVTSSSKDQRGLGWIIASSN